MTAFFYLDNFIVVARLPECTMIHTVQLTSVDPVVPNCACVRLCSLKGICCTFLCHGIICKCPFNATLGVRTDLSLSLVLALDCHNTASIF